MNDWKQKFDAAFAYEYDEISKDWIKDFIQSILDKQREELMEEIKSTGPDMIVPLPKPPYRDDYILVSDLLTKLEKK